MFDGRCQPRHWMPRRYLRSIGHCDNFSYQRSFEGSVKVRLVVGNPFQRKLLRGIMTPEQCDALGWANLFNGGRDAPYQAVMTGVSS